MQQPWALWWLQARRLTQIELRRNLFSRRASWIYFLAFIPTFIISIHAIFNSHDPSSISEDTKVLAGIVQLYYIRLGVFFGCLGIFSRLIRGEMIERSLHFYLLSPVRREVLLLSKFVAGSATALLLFVAAILADFALMYLRLREAGVFYKVLNTPERIDVIERMGSLSHEDAEFLRDAATFYRALDHGQRLSVGHAEGSLPPSRSQFDVLTELVKRWTPERLHAQPLDVTLREIRGRTREFFDRVFGGV